jgi:ATP-dependent helicase HrpB
MAPLPIEEVLGELDRHLSAGRNAVLTAPPGAGKTTRVPLALMDAPWLDGRRILMLEPRRLAARAAARFMAERLGEPVGRRVGYRVRLDSCVGPETRIEVLTEGVLTRRLQSDPGLSGVGLVIFDEFHERHLESDLGLALSLEVQAVLNPGLRLLAMSATMDTAPVSAILGAAPVVAGTGRLFEVEVRYAARRPAPPLEAAVADAVRAAARSEPGNILVFLPGAPEIRRTLKRLKEAGLPAEWILAPLFGLQGREEQDLAIAPPPAGRRKIVLATNIAETSLTIEGVRVVVDGGLARVPRFDAGSGMTRLVTLPISRASAEQRAGRAGRNEPGVCCRLWSREEHGMLAERSPPEILQADLASPALELALWGVSDPAALAWLDPPPEAAFGQARRLLADLGALDAAGLVTGHGRRLAALPLHPRLAHMVAEASDAGSGGAACDLAAVLSERDFLGFPPGSYDSDLQLRMDVLAEQRAGRATDGRHFSLDRSTCRRVRQVSEDLRRRLGPAASGRPARELGRLLAWAYPDRIGRRRPGGDGRYRLSNGRGAFFAGPEPLAASEYIVAAELDGDRREARIFRAAAADGAALAEQYAGRLERLETISWDARQRSVAAVRELKLGALTLGSEPMERADPERTAAALIQGIRAEGLGCLPWTPGLRQWQQRVGFLRRLEGAAGDWPDVSDEGLAAALETWLAPHLAGILRLQALKRLDLAKLLRDLLTHRQQRHLDEQAPTHLTVPSGSRLRVDYSGETPVLAVRLQEMFGCAEGPRLAGGRQAVLLHLLSPAGRPVQVTGDLAGFWSGSYRDVCKEMRGRYPKHPWPDDPRSARPTRSAKTRKTARPINPPKRPGKKNGG